MAIPHIRLKTISRGKRRSATGAAAYRSGTKIKDTSNRRRCREAPRRATEAAAYRSGSAIADDDGEGPKKKRGKGKVHDFRNKLGILRDAIMLPGGAPWELMERPVLWNGAEDVEPRCNSVVAREFDMAVPCELPEDEQWGIGTDIAQWLIDRLGVGVDICMHAAAEGEGHDQRNTHIHVMFTTRVITPEGFGEKTRVLDNMYTTGREEVRALRQAYCDFTNTRLEKAGLNIRIDVRTLEAQGIDRIPQIHVGPKSSAMDEKGVAAQSVTRADFKGRETDWEKIDKGLSRAEFNDKIIELNRLRENLGPTPLHVQIKNITRYIEILIEKCADLEAIIPASMLPIWARLLVERYRLKAAALIESFIQAKAEDEDRQDEKKREGIHARMKRMQQEIEELERAKERRQALQRLYTRIEHIATSRPSGPVASIERPPTRILSVEQFRVELVARAEMARARVPPEYRPRLAVKDVIWDTVDARHDEGSLGYHFHTGPPAYNGGLAEAPPPISQPFNAAAGLEPEQSCKQKVRIGFGLA